jgi:Flp pilus assembly protein TadD
MPGIQDRVLRRPKARTNAGFAFLAIVMSVLAGCAVEGKVDSLVSHEPVVARLADGRQGFVITEVPKLDETSRREFDQAVAMMKDQNYGHAIDLLNKVINQSPGVTAPYIDIAMAYEQIGDMERAEENLKTALKLFPDHPVACNEYGLLYRKTGRFAEARAIYEKAIARFPEYEPAHRNLGILCDLYLNDPACALKQYEIYSKARPEDKQVKMWIVDLQTRVGGNKGGSR